jgi:DNA-3-methyladenine glycosylase II
VTIRRNAAVNQDKIFLDPIAPFRLDLTVWALRRRAENEIDRWDGATYRRVLVVDGEPLEVAVAQIGTLDSPRLEVTVAGADTNITIKKAVIAILNDTLGLQVDLSKFYRFSMRHPKLDSLVGRFRGMRPPRFPSVFEALINAIACQQISLSAGIQLLNRLSRACGVGLIQNDHVTHAFPRPQDVAQRDPESLRLLGFSRQKSRAMIESARAIANGELNVNSLAESSDDVALAALQQMRGVGRWTAEYVLLRGLGRWHVFPGDDVGARNGLTRWLGLNRDLDYDGVQSVLTRWKTYAGLIYLHLLLDRLAEQGHIL